MEYVLILGTGTDIAGKLAQKYASAGYGVYIADNNVEKYNIDAQIFKLDIPEFYTHRNFYKSLNPAPVGVICAVDHKGDARRAQKDFLEAKRIIDTNYTGLVSFLNHVALDFEEKKKGFIIGLSCYSPKNEEPGLCIYKSAKAGFDSYLRSLSARLAGSRVRVMTAKHPLFMDRHDEFAQNIFTAWQKGKKIVYSAELKSFRAVIEGLGWK